MKREENPCDTAPLSDHGFNVNGNSQAQTSPLDVQSVDNQSHSNQFDIQPIIREVKGQDLTNSVEVLKFLQSKIEQTSRTDNF